MPSLLRTHATIPLSVTRSSWRIPRPILGGILLGGSYLALVGAGLRLNTTPSLPAGLYWAADPPTRIERGTTITTCLPSEITRLAIARGYLARGDCPGGVYPIGKIVYARAGDVVVHTPEALVINGETLAGSATQTHDSYGRPMPHAPFGERRLAEGELWLFSPHHPRSLDSRYFGVVREEDVREVLQPTWLF